MINYYEEIRDKYFKDVLYFVDRKGDVLIFPTSLQDLL